MSTELTMLAYAVAVFFAVVVVQGVSGVLANGLVPMAGNRDSLPPDSAFCARAKRAVQNHIEGLVLFAPLALIAAHEGVTSPMTVLASYLFAGGRAAHAVCYLIGIPWLRTLAWAVGATGIILMFLALFGLV
jgi:uncharacterized MAPEG superfamily protein